MTEITANKVLIAAFFDALVTVQLPPA